MTDSGGPLGFDPDEEPRPAPAAGPGAAIDDPAGLKGTGRSRVPLGIALFAAALLLVWVAINTVRNSGVPSSGLAAGRTAPPFAAPLASSARTGDVNVARTAGQGAAGSVPACTVRGAGILNSCDLMRRPTALVFFTPHTDRCVDALRQFERLRAGHPQVAIAAVALGGDRGQVRSLVRDLGVGYPVAYDRDSVLANLYGVAVCPLVTFVSAAGRVQGTVVGTRSTAVLDARLTALERSGA
jgi:hypothetical protein